ncbi:nucleotidyltransferase-like protein [Larkinella arboricola]|uniref:Nucleotidyltransferase-like protein n=1 Tax=Larkinella arboricola TaxID=643671 RepID=A0A327WP69_LARAB|nr:nucleotidyltransferase substrate binding protein [Larkinella arboricola]RAJ94004.1 nucleotidyltransferase-like protein [Larkinella arboricola]
MNQEIRWEQRFGSYKRVLAQLNKFIDKGELNELEEQGLIKAFEYTYELAWKTLQDFLRNKATSTLQVRSPLLSRPFRTVISTVSPGSECIKAVI